MKIFSLDGPFQKYGTMLFDLLLLNLLWGLSVVLTLGIGTGAATTALFYTVNKSVIGDKGYLMSNYFKSFKSNFVQATLVWLILGAAYALVLVNLFVFDLRSFSGGSILVIVNYVVLYQLTILIIYIFPVMSKIEIKKIRGYFLTAFRLSNAHIISSITCVAVLITTAVVLYFASIYIMLAISVAALLISKVVIGVVMKKYWDLDAEAIDLDQEL